MRVKTLSNTNLAASSHIIKEKASLPVDVHRLKTPLLKLPIGFFWCFLFMYGDERKRRPVTMQSSRSNMLGQ